MSDRTAIVNEIVQRRVSAIVRTNDQRLAGDAMRAAVEGGFRLGEFALTTPGALELITDFAKKPDLLLGAGTVLTVDQARAAVNAGPTLRYRLGSWSVAKRLSVCPVRSYTEIVGRGV